MSFLQEISEEQLNRDHRSQLIGGTDMYTLMGHGYLEKGETHLDAIMAVWERKRGLGTKSKVVNEAMRTGIEQEPAVYRRLMKDLAEGRLEAVDSGYAQARLYEPFRGMRLQNGAGDGYGLGGNMDAPLFDVSGEYVDPNTGATISGEDYARRYAEEFQKIQLQHEVNRARELDGEEPWPVSKPRYQAPPFAGVIDIKVTQSASVFYDEIYTGISPRFVIQTHHYNEVLRNESRRLGFDTMHDPALMGIYRYCLENNRTHYHEIEYDTDLAAEMRRRAELFTEKCLKQGIPPNSSELRDEFYVFPIKGTEPAAQLPDMATESKFKDLLDKYEELRKRQKKLKEYEDHIKRDLGLGVHHVNGSSPDNPDARLAGVFVDERIVSLEKKFTNSKVINEAALNGALLAGGEARAVLSQMQTLLSSNTLDPVAQLDALKVLAKKVDVSRLPGEGAQFSDFKSTQRHQDDDYSLVIKANKNTRITYKKLIQNRDLEQPEQVTATPVEPEELTMPHAKPEQVTATQAQPEQVTTTQAEPGQLTMPHAKPEQVMATQAQPEQVTTTQAEPEQLAMPHAKPEQVTATQAQPEQVTTTPAEPEQITMPHAKPEQDTTQLAQPNQVDTTSGDPAWLEPPRQFEQRAHSRPPLTESGLVELRTQAGALDKISLDEPLEEVALNDELEMVDAGGGRHFDHPSEQSESDVLDLVGLASRPKSDVEAKGPDLLAGNAPEGLAGVLPPEELFGAASASHGAESSTRLPDLGIEASPFAS